MEMDKKSFPEGWKHAKLGDIVDKVSVKALPKDFPDYPFIGMDCIEAHSLKPAFTYKFGEFKSAGNLFKKGQVLYGRMRPYLNKVYKADYEGTCSGEFIILQCKDNFKPELLQYILHAKGFVSFATHQTAGDRPRISFDEIAEYTISLPPLAEQQLIVAKIEELFSELDAGKRELEKAAQQLKVYRQAVLKWAFEGRLTNDAVVDGELPDGWKLTKLGSILKVSSGQGINVRNLKEGDYPVYCGNGINGYHSQFLIEEPVLIIGRVGAKCGVTHITQPKSWVTDNALIVTPKVDNFNLKFFQLRLEFENLNKLSVATAQPVISGSKIYAHEIALPPLEEQHRIVQEIEARLSVCDKIEETIAGSMQGAEVLRQSILKKAFEGKLLASVKAPVHRRRDPRTHPLERKALVSYLIWKGYQDPRFGKTRLQKELLFAEYTMQVEYEKDFEQKPHGPWDYFIDDLIREAEQEGWFYTSRTPNGQIRFEPGPNMHSLLNEHMHYLREHDAELKSVLGFVDAVEDLPELELYATIYAVWNNHIIRHQEPALDGIIADVRAWSDVKAQYSDAEIEEAMYTLEGNGLKPVGWGRPIDKFEN